MTDHIYIVGTGSIGRALAVFLTLKKTPVTLIRGSKDDLPAHTEEIQITLPDKSVLSATVEINTLSNIEALDGIVVLCNKSYGNPELARRLWEKANACAVVLLQNGLGVEGPFIDAGYPEIYRCVLFATSQPGIIFKLVAPSPIGVIKGGNDRLTGIVGLLTTPGFPFLEETNIQPVIWKKAIVNSAFNSICPLLNVDNGIFHRDPAVLSIAKRVIAECVAVAQKQHIALDVEDVVQSLLLISKSSDGQLISTLQDINHQRQTEIETLNFEIVRQAQGLPVPETKLLGELTRLRSDLSRGLNRDNSPV